jgi:hypothetical protein
LGSPDNYFDHHVRQRLIRQNCRQRVTKNGGACERAFPIARFFPKAPLCVTENQILVDDVMEAPKLAE